MQVYYTAVVYGVLDKDGSILKFDAKTEAAAERAVYDYAKKNNIDLTGCFIDYEEDYYEVGQW